MRDLNEKEIVAIKGGLMKELAEIAGVVCGGIVADMGAPAVVAGLIGYGVTEGLEYNMSHPAASAAITRAYTSGAAI